MHTHITNEKNMKGLVGDTRLVGGLGPGPPWPPLKSGPAKINPSITCSDYRPIFFTLILARIIEKAISRITFIQLLCFMTIIICFKISLPFAPQVQQLPPLFILLYTITELLQTQDHVHIIAVDLID